jgi:hypothetical protein
MPADSSATDTAAPTKKHPRRRLLKLRPVYARSRISNGREILSGVDGRSATARRYFDLVQAICNDLGGVDRMSEARLQLIRRFAAASVIAEQMEARLANGEQINIAEHALLSSTLVRIVRRIGINRRARKVIPDLEDYLDGKAEIVGDEEEDEE